VPELNDNPLLSDLCDHFHIAQDHRCTRYWRQVFVLDREVHVGGNIMFGDYPAGTWHFCNMHARIFQRDRHER